MDKFKDGTAELEEIYELLHGERFSRADEVDEGCERDYSLEQIIQEVNRDKEQEVSASGEEPVEEPSAPMEPVAPDLPADAGEAFAAVSSSEEPDDSGQDHPCSPLFDYPMGSMLGGKEELDALFGAVDREPSEERPGDRTEPTGDLFRRWMHQREREEEQEQTVPLEPDDVERLQTEYQRKYTALSLRTGICGVFTLLLGYIAVAPGCGFALPAALSPLEHSTLYLWAQLALFLLGGAMAFSQLAMGLRKLIVMQADNWSLLGFGMLLCTVQGVVQTGGAMLDGSAVFYGAVPAFGVLVALWGELRQTAARRHALSLMADDSMRCLGLLEDEALVHALCGGVEDGQPHDILFCSSRKEPTWGFEEAAVLGTKLDGFVQTATPLCIGFSLVATAVAVLVTQQAAGVLVLFSALLSACIPFGIGLAETLPFDRTQRELASAQAAIASAGIAQRLQDVEGVLLRERDVFGPEMVALKGLRICNDHRVDKMIVELGSLFDHLDCALADVFLKTMRYDCSMLVAVQETQVDDDGLSALVDGCHVDVGSADYLRRCGVFLPTRLRDIPPLAEGNALVFAARDGELACVFAVEYLIDPSVRRRLQALADADVTIYVRSRDMNLDAVVLAARLGLRPNILKLVRDPLNCELEVEMEHASLQQSGCYSTGKPAAVSALAVGMKKLSTRISRNVLLCLVAMAVTPLLALALILMSGIGQLTVCNLLLVQLVWLVPVLLSSRL